MKPAPYRGVPGRYMPKARARKLHIFQSTAFWLAMATPLFLGPIGWLATGSAPLGLAYASLGLALAALVACTVVDLISMRIPNPLCWLPVGAAVLWWAAQALGAPLEAGAGFGRTLYGPVAPGIGVGTLVPDLSGGVLWKEIALSIAAAVLVFIPLMASYVIGAMGGGDVKFVPPFALYLGWSLAFDLLFLTFLLGGLIALVIQSVRWAIMLVLKRLPGHYPEWERFARMRHIAYAPAIAAAGVFCLAAKWEGLIG